MNTGFSNDLRFWVAEYLTPLERCDPGKFIARHFIVGRARDSRSCLTGIMDVGSTRIQATESLPVMILWGSHAITY